MEKYMVYSKKDNLYEVEVFGYNYSNACCELLHLNGYDDFIFTDWNVFDSGDNLVVSQGIHIEE